MKAARYYGPGNVKLDEVPEPQAKEGQVKIKVYPSTLDRLYFFYH
jgi:NADPH:quinone reductase-like Zn-dependent oxidoreductase